MDLLFTLIVIGYTGLVLYRRYRADHEGDRAYNYALAALLAFSIGVLVTGLYVRDTVQFVLPLLFFLIVLAPQLLILLRERQFRNGQFQYASRVQQVICLLVWSTSEREIQDLAEAARLIRDGQSDRAGKRLKDLGSRRDRPDAVSDKMMQVRILLHGQERNWVTVHREFERLNARRHQDIWTPTVIHVAQAGVETGRFDLAEQMLEILDRRPLTDQQELASRTVRLGYLMLQGRYDAGKLLLDKICEEYEEAIPEAYGPYWKARGCQQIGRFDEAQRLFERSLEQVEREGRLEWKQVIQERIRELEIERNRRETSTGYRFQGQELDHSREQTVDRSLESIPEAEPIDDVRRESTPSMEVLQFIQKVNRLPRATVVLLVVIGGIFLSMLMAVQKQYPEGSGIPDASRDPVALVVFGMKADYMLDEPYETGPVQPRERLEEARKALDRDLIGVSNLSTVKRQLNESMSASADTRGEVNDQHVRNLWIEARFAEMFGWTEQGSIDFPRHQYWRLATCTLLHIGWIHLLLNGYALWILGKLLENIYGFDDFLIIYLISGLTGSIASWKFGASPASAGASGAIFGLLGAAISLTILKKEGVPEKIRSRLAGPLVFWTLVNLALGFAIANIDNAGHIGGMVGGLIFGYLLPSRRSAGGRNSVWWMTTIKWIGLTFLTGIYLWAIYRGVLFAFEYTPQIP